MPMDDGVKTILAIDGGGIRGLIPALTLAELTNRLKSRGKDEALHRYFDLIVGTSTGGIIAAGLAAPHPNDENQAAMTAQGLVDLYRQNGNAIFDRDRFRNIREAFERFTLTTIFQEKYSADSLQQILQEHLGDSELRDALTNVVITAYDIDSRRTVWLRGGSSINALNDDMGSKHNFYFWEAARATSAAPTYFEPAAVTNLATKETLSLVDGGVFANQPAVCGFAEARALGWRSDKINVLSLGTGYQTRSFKFDDARDWGPGHWINPMKGAPIISILMHGQADATNWQMTQMLGDAFTRLDAKLVKGRGNDDMDDASPENLEALSKLADDIIRDNDEVIGVWADRLRSNPN